MLFNKLTSLPYLAILEEAEMTALRRHKIIDDRSNCLYCVVHDH